MRTSILLLLMFPLCLSAQSNFSITHPVTISPTSGYSKYVSAVRDDKGICWATFTNSSPHKDEIYVSRQTGNTWEQPQRLDQGMGSENFSSLLYTASGDIWAFWQGIRQGSAAVYYRVRHGQAWGPEKRLTASTITALHPQVLSDGAGRIWVVYEKTAHNSINLEAIVYDNGKWSAPLQLNQSSFNRRASLATDGQNIWLAWDSPASGNYDIYLTNLSFSGRSIKAAPAIQVTKDAGIDDSPSLSMAKDGTLWIGWNSCRSLRHEYDRSKRHSGAIFLKGYKDGKWVAAGKITPDAMDGQVSLPDFDKSPDDAVDYYWHWKETQNYPHLSMDAKGRLWVFWRAEPTGAHNFDIFTRVYDGARWSDVCNLSKFSPGRDEWPQVLAMPDGSLRIFWEGQELPPPGEEDKFKGGDVDTYNTRANRNVILTGELIMPEALCHIAAPSYEFPEEITNTEDDLEKPLAVAPALQRTDSITGKQLFFGDLHSHTVYSDGKYGWPDQLLYLSRYKLGIDVSVISDHSEMGLLQRAEFDELLLMAKVFSEEGHYLDYPGFEWTAPVDYGHRIVIFPGLEGEPLSSALPEGNTIEKLYAFVRRWHAIVSAHHTAQATWGRWNPAAFWSVNEEPNFELASWHGRFEYYNNPHEGRRQVPGHQYQDALKLGRHVGVLGGSDTHFLSPGEGGLTAVWADSMTRHSIFQAWSSRHTYATTGARMGLQFHINGQLMGSEIISDTALSITVAVQGTAAIDHIEIVKDISDAYALVRVQQPAGDTGGVYMLYDPARPQGGKNIRMDDLRNVTFSVHEPLPDKPSSYYIRVTQVDGQQAWSSPIWVNCQYSPAKHYPQDLLKYDTTSKLFQSAYTPKAPPGAPNIVIVLLDDVGFSTAGTFGGLAATPVFDSLARRGLRYTNFHTTALCAPSRAALLTGRNHHSVHMGHFTETAFDAEGYDGYMPFEKATMAEVLRENGYNSFAVGKWHLTPVAERTAAGPFNRWPTGRGFDRWYGFLESATDQYYPVLWEGITRSPIDTSLGKHLNTYLADKAISYIRDQQRAAPGKPFFLYIAPGAVHSPLQVDKEWIDKYRGKFDMGWDAYREIVLANQKKLGVVPAYATLPPRNEKIPAWASLSDEEKKVTARAMEAHAGFLSQVDEEVGRVIRYIASIGQMDNTIIMVIIGDNGATKYTADIPGVPAGMEKASHEQRVHAAFQHIDEIGRKDFKGDIPLGWTQATNTPFKLWKGDANAEGGTHNPMILFAPGFIRKGGGIRDQYVHLIDVWPTLLELTKVKIPASINGYPQQPLEGISFAYSLNDPDAGSRHTVQYYETGASRALYKDGWKVEAYHPLGGSWRNDTWELYDMIHDFNERIDLAKKYPQKLRELRAVFEQEAKKYHLYPLHDSWFPEDEYLRISDSRLRNPRDD